MHHYLKCLDVYFDQIDREIKTFEIRNSADRDFKVGDVCSLIRINKNGFVSDQRMNYIEVEITYLSGFSQPVNQVVFAFKILTRNYMDRSTLRNMLER